MNNLTNENILVCYLITKFDDENTLLTFLENYKNFKSGYPHELLICFKLFNKDRLEIFRKLLININHTEFIDENINNDFDLGSYSRVALKYPSRHIFFLNSYSYPICDNWLNIIIKNYVKNSILATSASYESFLSSIKLKKLYKIFHYLIKLIQYKKLFYPFPNPHIRTTGFLLYAKDFIDFYNNKKCQNKHDAWKLESGRDSLTNFFLKKKFPVKLINSDGNSFKIDNWINSNTYCYLEKSKLIISDKHTRKYEVLNNSEKKLYQKNVWGV